MKREVSASYTVEASFVMAVAFFFIAALLNGVFEVHGRITGRWNGACIGRKKRCGEME